MYNIHYEHKNYNGSGNKDELLFIVFCHPKADIICTLIFTYMVNEELGCLSTQVFIVKISFGDEVVEKGLPEKLARKCQEKRVSLW